MQELEEGEVALQKDTKQQKVAKDPRDKRSTFVDNLEEQTLAKVRLQQRTWSPWPEVDGAAIPWNASVKKFQRCHSAYIAEVLEQPLLLPKDMDAVRKLKQQYLFMSLKRGLTMVISQPHTFYLLSTSIFFFTWGCYIFLVQITHEVFVSKEWVKEAQNKVKNEVHLRLETEKALGAVKEENKELLPKLTTEEKERKSAQVGLKNAKAQVEDQRKLLYQTEIELAISRQLVMELKAKLQKAKEATQLTKEAIEAEK